MAVVIIVWASAVKQARILTMCTWLHLADKTKYGSAKSNYPYGVDIYSPAPRQSELA